LPAHLLMNFRLVDEHGASLAISRSLAQLRAAHGGRAQTSFQRALASIASRLPSGDDKNTAAGTPELPGSEPEPRARQSHNPKELDQSADAALVGVAGQRFTDWSFGHLPEIMELRRGRDTLIGYPALLDCGDAVELQVFDDPASAHEKMRDGLRRLFALALKEPLRFFERNMPDAQKLGLLYSALGSAEELRGDLVTAVIDRACMAEPWPTDAPEFSYRVSEARPRLNLIGQEIARMTLAILTEWQAVMRKLSQSKGQAQAHADLEQQLSGLIVRRFASCTPPAQFAHLVRYLKAASMRIDKLRTDSARELSPSARAAQG
ncbi:MAG: DUF3418 domain-containing protein, partial [Quisquiliibacterium sp.]